MNFPLWWTRSNSFDAIERRQYFNNICLHLWISSYFRTTNIHWLSQMNVQYGANSKRMLCFALILYYSKRNNLELRSFNKHLIFLIGVNDSQERERVNHFQIEWIWLRQYDEKGVCVCMTCDHLNHVFNLVYYPHSKKFIHSRTPHTVQ